MNDVEFFCVCVSFVMQNLELQTKLFDQLPIVCDRLWRNSEQLCAFFG